MGTQLHKIGEFLRDRGIDSTIEGDPQTVIERVAGLETAGAGDISFVSNPKYIRKLQSTKAGAVLVSQSMSVPAHVAALRVEDAYYALPAVIELLQGLREHPMTGIDERATIHAGARIGANARIGAWVTIEDDVVIGDNAVIYPGCYVGRSCRVGDDVLLFANVVLYDNTVVGDRVTVHSGSVIGNDGFGYATYKGVHHKIPQVGNVVLEDDVEIGSNCSIDRATLDSTVIGAGTKFSNLIAIGHGTQLGEHCLLVAQVGVAGTVKTGHHLTLGGQVGVAGHISIGNYVTAGAKAGIANDVKDGQVVLGQPARPISQAKREVAALQKLPELRKQIRRMERELADLRQMVSDLSDASESDTAQ